MQIPRDDNQKYGQMLGADEGQLRDFGWAVQAEG